MIKLQINISAVMNFLGRVTEKEIVREVVRGDKHNLRKSADRKAQISVTHSAQ